VPGYALLSEKMTDMITKDALEVVKNTMKPRGVTEKIDADKWVEEYMPKDHLLTTDHIEAIKVRYMDPSVKDCVTLNLKQLETDIKELDKKKPAAVDSEDDEEDEDYEYDDFDDKVLLKEDSAE